jgi:hypothetical protein
MKDFVDRILSLYLELPDVAARRASRLDRDLAAALFHRGITLDQVEAALLVAHQRRALREPPLPPIRSLHYFAPVIDEIASQPLDRSWLDYLRRTRTNA